MEQSPTITKLATALCAFQSEIETIKYDSQVKVETQKGSYSFKFASLAVILKAIKPHMLKNKLSISQLTEDSGAITTLLMHESGEYLKSTLKLPIDVSGGKNDIQKIGSAITYARRYAISAILGISTDEDEDGNTASGNTLKDKSEPAKNRPASSPAPVDARPWITEGQYKSALARIWDGDLELCQKLHTSYRLRKAFSEKLTEACEKASAKYGESILPFAQRKLVIDQLALMNTEEEVDGYAQDQGEDFLTNPACRSLVLLRKKAIQRKKTGKK